jgi:drug/metabolite transporter (DMT)-like permease
LVGGLRYTSAGAILALLLTARAEPLPARVQWGGHALLGILMIGIGNGGVIWAQQWVPTGVAAVVVASTPFWMTSVEACWPAGDRLSRRILFGLAVGFGGRLLLVWPDLNADGAAVMTVFAGIATVGRQSRLRVSASASDEKGETL